MKKKWFTGIQYHQRRSESVSLDLVSCSEIQYYTLTSYVSDSEPSPGAFR